MIPRKEMYFDNRFDLEKEIEKIKQKIKEAQEPRLIVDGNGEIKEI